jgi:hypothetical protein
MRGLPSAAVRRRDRHDVALPLERGDGVTEHPVGTGDGPGWLSRGVLVGGRAERGPRGIANDSLQGLSLQAPGRRDEDPGGCASHPSPSLLVSLAQRASRLDPVADEASSVTRVHTQPAGGERSSSKKIAHPPGRAPSLGKDVRHQGWRSGFDSPEENPDRHVAGPGPWAA